MDVTQRFSDRVAAYTRGRPGYPLALVGALELRRLTHTARLYWGTC